MDFWKVLNINPTIQICDIKAENMSQNNTCNKIKYYINGFIDLDESSGIHGKYMFKMKDKSFVASFIGKCAPTKGIMKLSQLHKIMT